MSFNTMAKRLRESATRVERAPTAVAAAERILEAVALIEEMAQIVAGFSEDEESFSSASEPSVAEVKAWRSDFESGGELPASPASSPSSPPDATGFSVPSFPEWPESPPAREESPVRAGIRPTRRRLSFGGALDPVEHDEVPIDDEIKAADPIYELGQNRDWEFEEDLLSSPEIKKARKKRIRPIDDEIQLPKIKKEVSGEPEPVFKVLTLDDMLVKLEPRQRELLLKIIRLKTAANE